jgi:hypothetical protein
VTPTWLNRILSGSGALTSGAVTSVTVAPVAGDNSNSYRLSIAYDSNATGELPQRLWLKTCQGGVFGPSEVLYYTRDYLDVPDAPVLRAYDATYDNSGGAYHVLLDDVSDSHRWNWDSHPTAEYAATLGRSMAALHAPYWTQTQRISIDAVMPDLAAIRRALEPGCAGLEPMLLAADGIEPDWADVLRQVWNRYPAVLGKRARNPAGFTVVHGDANPGNILSPVHGHEPLWLIDRQPFSHSLTTWLGAGDLAYAIVPRWDMDDDRGPETTALQAWHGELTERRILDYSWEQALDDYRLSAVMSLYVAAEWCVNEHDRVNMRWLWLPMLHRSIAAFRDLGCNTLLDIGVP